jgi:quercetin dioxygenase-like cupin family protein
MNKKVAYLLVPFGMLMLSAAASAQQQPAPPGPKATVLTTQPVTGLPDKEFLMITAELAPGASSGLHTHPGDEFGIVIEGTLMVKIGTGDFKPVSAGQTFNAPQGTPMEIKNTSNQTIKVINVLINEKGKPRSTPVHSDH